MQKWKMGLDLGTTSVALACWCLDEMEKPVELVHWDCEIFNEPIQPKTMATNNTQRASARLQRRQIDRKARRKVKLAHIAKRLGITALPDSALDILQMRVNARTQKISMENLFRCLFHIEKKRGNNLGLESQSNIGKCNQNIEELRNKINPDDPESVFLSDIFIHKREQAKTAGKPWKKLHSLKNDKTKGTFVARDFIKQEFNAIMDEQEKHHPILNDIYHGYPKDAFITKPNELFTYREAIKQTIFHQRPIRWDADTIGDCAINPQYKASIKAQPAFQEFRIRKFTNDLEWKSKQANGEKHLSTDQRNTIFQHLNENLETIYSELYELLSQKGIAGDGRFSMDRTIESDSKIAGNKTAAIMKKFGMENQWQGLTKEEQALTIDSLSFMTDIEVIGRDDLHDFITKAAKTMYDGKPPTDREIDNIKSFLNYFKGHKNFDTLAKMGFEAGRINYSTITLQDINRLMTTGLAEHEAIDQLKQDYVAKFGDYAKKGLTENINNPSVIKALKVFKRLYKHACHKMGGPPSQIILEMQREMKQSYADRKETEDEIKKNTKENIAAREAIEKDDYYASMKRIRKYRLAKIQNFKCAYSGEQICIDDLLSDQTQIDHIIPQVRGGSNSFKNLVVVKSELNLSKGNKTPFEAFFDGKYWSHIEAMADRLGLKKAQEKIEDAKNKKAKKTELTINEKKALALVSDRTPNDVEDAAMDRRNTEMGFISREIQNWLKETIPYDESIDDLNDRVIPLRGVLTGFLRQKWGINHILPELRIEEGKPLMNLEYNRLNNEEWQLKQKSEDKEDKEWCKDPINKFDKRCDHRHHLLDAAILGLATRGMLQRATRNALETQKGPGFKLDKQSGEIFKDETSFNCPIDNLYTLLKERLRHHVVWFKPDRYGDGRFFEETAYGMIPNDDRLYKKYPLEDLLGKGKAATLKNIETRTVGEDIKQSIKQQFLSRMGLGMSEKEALLGREGYSSDGKEDGIYYPIHTNNRVKAVRLYYKLKGLVKKTDKDYSIDMPSDKGIKTVYISDGYACAKIIKDEQGKAVDFELITKLQYQSLNPTDKSDLIFKDDMVLYDNQIWLVSSFNAEQGIYTKKWTETRSFADLIKLKQGLTKIISRKRINDIKVIRDRSDLIKSLAKIQNNHKE